MMIQTTNILDGIKNGIAAYIHSRKTWVKRSDGRNCFFPNFATLEARLFREQDLDYHDVSFYFLINEINPALVNIQKAPIRLSLNEAVKTETGWRISRYEQVFNQQILHIYNLVEEETYVVTNIGYIDSVLNGDHDEAHDARYEYRKLKNLVTMVNDAVTQMAQFQCYGMSISKSKFGMDIKLDNTTAHLHIWKNSRLMDYNTEIKKMRDQNISNEYRCLPFLKDKDKYGTLYMFVTIEDSDSQCTYTRTRADQVEENLMLYLTDLYPDKKFNYVPCPFMGKIIISKEVDIYGTSDKDRS